MEICPVRGLLMIRMGEDRLETLNFKPGSLYAIGYIRSKYAISLACVVGPAVFMAVHFTRPPRLLFHQ